MSKIKKWLEERTNQSKIIIIGAGSLGKMTASSLIDNEEYEINNIAFLDDGIPVGQKLLDFEVIGNISDLNLVRDYKNVDFVISIANNRVRKELAENYAHLNYINVIHNTANISRYSSIGIGNIILPNASIDPDAIVKNHVIINKNSTIGHNVTLNHYSQVCPGSNLGGIIGEGVFLGMGSIILPNIKVGKNSIIGAGAVVNKNIPENCTAIGTPAQPIKFHE